LERALSEHMCPPLETNSTLHHSPPAPPAQEHAASTSAEPTQRHPAGARETEPSTCNHTRMRVTRDRVMRFAERINVPKRCAPPKSKDHESHAPTASPMASEVTVAGWAVGWDGMEESLSEDDDEAQAEIVPETGSPGVPVRDARVLSSRDHQGSSSREESILFWGTSSAAPSHRDRAAAAAEAAPEPDLDVVDEELEFDGGAIDWGRWIGGCYHSSDPSDSDVSSESAEEPVDEAYSGD